MDLEAVIQRHEEAFKKIAGLAPQFKREMMKLDENAYKVRAEISKEAISCRIHNRKSIRYHELVAKLEETVNTMEHYLTLATLLT